jgi:hypothetical protein
MLVGASFWYRDLRLYDRATSRWSVPAPPPRPLAAGPPDGIFSLHRVWTGTELVVLPSESDIGKAAASYNPKTNEWRELAGLPPVTRLALWNGSAVVGYAEPLALFEGIDRPPGQAEAGVYRYVP